MRRLALLLMAVIGMVAAPALAKDEEMSPNVNGDPKIAVVERMIEAWNTRNWQLVGDLFAEDGVLHSMMIEPVVGRPAIASRINGLGAGISQITLDIQRIGRVGDAVIIERVDRFTYNGHYGEVPVVGVLTVEGDHIKVWREYYDRAQLVAALGLKEDFHK